MKPIYPIIEIINEGLKSRINTYLRKKHTDGLWYLIPIVQSCSINTNSLNFFHKRVYQYLFIGSISPNWTDAETGDLIYVLDEDQRSEEERLKIVI